MSQWVLPGVDFQWNGHIFDGGRGDRWSQARHFEVQIVERRLVESSSGIIWVTREFTCCTKYHSEIAWFARIAQIAWSQH